MKKTSRNQNENSPRRGKVNVDKLSTEIDRLAEEIRQKKKGGRLDPTALGQLDELTDLLRKQHAELQAEADEANDLLGACQDELERAQSQSKTFQKLRTIQSNDRHQSRRDAA